MLRRCSVTGRDEYPDVFLQRSLPRERHAVRRSKDVGTYGCCENRRKLQWNCRSLINNSSKSPVLDRMKFFIHSQRASVPNAASWLTASAFFAMERFTCESRARAMAVQSH